MEEENEKKSQIVINDEKFTALRLSMYVCMYNSIKTRRDDAQ